MLMRVGGRAPGVLPRSRTDLRLGVARELGRAELQLVLSRSGASAGFLDERQVLLERRRLDVGDFARLVVDGIRTLDQAAAYDSSHESLLLSVSPCIAST